MAGTIVIDTVKSSTTGAPAFQNTSGTQIGTLCRAWVQFAGASGTIAAGFNVSSVTRASTGVYTVNLTNALADANYAVVVTAGASGQTESQVALTFTTTSFAVQTQRSGTGVIDDALVSVAVFR